MPDMDTLFVNASDEVARLQNAIRRHRDHRGDDRCYQDDAELYTVLPEGDTRPARETAVTIENCQRYIECRQQGREYVSPQRRIEELEAEVARLRHALARSNYEITQTLGKALGYPLAYPDTSEVDDGSVCVGEHTAETLATEAAKEMKRLNDALDGRY